MNRLHQSPHVGSDLASRSSNPNYPTKNSRSFAFISGPKKAPVLFSLTLLISLFTLSPTLSAQRYVAGDIVQNFSLTNRATGQPVNLTDFEGKIVFLEWFAYWCPFCQAAAEQTKTGIVDYYESRQGTPAGIPVLHVAINLQADAEALTQGFINTYSLGLVLNDFNRSLASKFQPNNQPIFAIINGVANSPSHAQWELLHTSLGYLQTVHPITTFRQAIDAVQAAPAILPPSIENQPQPTRIPTGTTLELSIQAIGDQLSYQWHRDASPLPGQTAATLSIPNTTSAHTGNYTVTISNPAGTLTSATAQVEVVTSLADYLAAANLTGPEATPQADPDRDGHPNVFEYLAQTDPNDPKSFPDQILVATPTPTGATLEIQFTPSPSSIGYAINLISTKDARFIENLDTITSGETGAISQNYDLTPEDGAYFARIQAIEN